MITEQGTTTYVNRPPRPLLARVAESAFWMSRYMERAEHVARILLVNINSLLDVGDIDAGAEKAFWAGPMQIFHVDHTDTAKELLELPRHQHAARITHHMTFDESNGNSILSCITRARENARSIRENISTEMWENLNTLYWSLRSEDAAGRFDESPTDLLKQVTNGSMLFQGLAEQTLGHGQPWQFIELGKYLERIDVTCRVLEVRIDALRAVEEAIETTERNMHLLSIVRSCCALESFRRNVGEFDTDAISAFLLLERRFPRSVCFAAACAHHAISRISRETQPTQIDPAESILGRLAAQLQYAREEDVNTENLAKFVDEIQEQSSQAAVAVKNSYFLK